MSAERPTDDDLMLLAHSGDMGAFDSLVRRHQADALAFAARYLGNDSLAKDAAQRAFVELYRYLPRYEPRGRFRALFLRILVNQCRMLQRKNGRIRAVADAVENASPPAPPPLQDTLVVNQQRKLRLEKAVQRISPKLRDVVLLRFTADMAYAEIATTLGIKVGTVKSRLSAGLEALRKELDGDS